MVEVTCFFRSDSVRLTEEVKAQLDQVALQMKGEYDPDLRTATAAVTGHASSSEKATAESHVRLAELRAEFVKNYLVTRHGIDAMRITTAWVLDATADPDFERKAVIVLS